MKDINKKNKSKVFIGVILAVLAAILLVLGITHSITNNEDNVDATTPEKEYVKLSGDIDGLTKRQIELIENNIIPQASDFFEYEEARVYYDKRAGYVISFVVSNESFGATYGEFYEPTLSHKQSDAIEMIHENIILASVKLNPIIRQKDGVTMEFKLPKMDNILIMKVRDGEVIKTVFEEGE